MSMMTRSHANQHNFKIWIHICFSILQLSHTWKKVLDRGNLLITFQDTN